MFTDSQHSTVASTVDANSIGCTTCQRESFSQIASRTGKLMVLHLPLHVINIRHNSDFLSEGLFQKNIRTLFSPFKSSVTEIWTLPHLIRTWMSCVVNGKQQTSWSDGQYSWFVSGRFQIQILGKWLSLLMFVHSFGPLDRCKDSTSGQAVNASLFSYHSVCHYTPGVFRIFVHIKCFVTLVPHIVTWRHISKSL